MQIILRKLHFLFIIGIIVTMPFSLEHLKLNSYFIILFAINSVPLYFFSKEKPNSMFVGLLFLFIAVYLVHIVGLLRTDNFHEATIEFQKKISLLLFPVIFFYSPKLTRKEIKVIFLSFVISCLSTGIFCLLIATYRFFLLNDSAFFFYHELSGIAGMHAVYLSMYCCFTIAILLNMYFEQLRYVGLKEKFFFYSSILILVITIILLSSRMSIFILVVGMIVYFTIHFNKKISLSKSILGAILIGFFILVVVLLFPKNRDRFKEAVNGKQETIDKHWGWGGRATRQLMWTCSFEIIKKNPIVGAGTGDVQDELQKCYSDNKYTILTYYSQKTRYNAHNQFLETTIELGIFGLTILLLSLVIALYHAFKQEKVIYFIFIILFFASCLTESMLERQNGIVFFAFFNSFFCFAYKNIMVKN